MVPKNLQELLFSLGRPRERYIVAAVTALVGPKVGAETAAFDPRSVLSGLADQGEW